MNIHVAEYLHRDIKPNNILVTEDGIPKITDFGIAKPRGELNQTPACGVYKYMSPEFFNG
jgi:serine/threonine protein kinase